MKHVEREGDDHAWNSSSRWPCSRCDRRNTRRSRAVTLPQADALDRLPAEYTRHNREHRMWEIERNMERQDRYGRHRYGRDYDRGYGYGRRHGGPPPWAPAHGYRRHHYERF